MIETFKIDLLYLNLLWFVFPLSEPTPYVTLNLHQLLSSPNYFIFH